MKDPAALLYIDTLKVATTEMSAIARAYYMDLILHQYDKGSLPNDIEELANICRVRFSEFKQFEQVFEQVLKHKFKQNNEGRLENEFATEIIRKRQSFIDKRSESGKISYMVRFARQHLKATKAQIEYLKDNVNLDSVDIKNEQVFKQVLEQVLEQKSELYINGDGDGDKGKNSNDVKYSFESFWNRYHTITGKPKTDKEPALKKWNALNKEEQKKAVDNIQPYCDSIDNKKYAKKARSYLGDKNFNDEFKPTGQVAAVKLSSWKSPHFK
jgi:hypothetical protein